MRSSLEARRKPGMLWGFAFFYDTGVGKRIENIRACEKTLYLHVTLSPFFYLSLSLSLLCFAWRLRRAPTLHCQWLVFWQRAFPTCRQATGVSKQKGGSSGATAAICSPPYLPSPTCILNSSLIPASHCLRPFTQPWTSTAKLCAPLPLCNSNDVKHTGNQQDISCKEGHAQLSPNAACVRLQRCVPRVNWSSSCGRCPGTLLGVGATPRFLPSSVLSNRCATQGWFDSAKFL